MARKTMVIGLGPEYNYDSEDHSVWSSNNTRYASNHGASLISRTLISLFQADYVDDLDHPEKYADDYDLCVLAFATHITTWRDVSVYTRFVKALGIKTVAFSLGIQDFSQSTVEVNTLHPSMQELLTYVLSTSKVIGVRGPKTASVLIKAGFKSKQVVRFGCPTLFGPLNNKLEIHKPDSFSKPVVVFQRTLAGLNRNILSSGTLLGQDFMDEAVFTNNLSLDNPTIARELREIRKLENGEFALEMIKKNGVFPRTFDNWFQEISNSDFVVGARLHGCIAGLIQGIPSVMLARDARVVEIAEFFQIPYVKYDDVGDMTLEDIYQKADFNAFNNLFPSRFDNFIKLLDDNYILDRLSTDNSFNVPNNFIFTEDDLNANNEIIFRELADVQQRLWKFHKMLNKLQSLYNRLKKVPGMTTVQKIIK